MVNAPNRDLVQIRKIDWAFGANMYRVIDSCMSCSHENHTLVLHFFGLLVHLAHDVMCFPACLVVPNEVALDLLVDD